MTYSETTNPLYCVENNCRECGSNLRNGDHGRLHPCVMCARPEPKPEPEGGTA